MQIAIVGLGRMGKNIALHLVEQGVSVVAYNRSRDSVDEVVRQGAIGAYTLADIPKNAKESPLVVFLYLPSGVVIDEVLFGAKANVSQNESDRPREKVQSGLVDLLPKGSIIIDGGNSFFKDSQRRYRELKNLGFPFLDMGTSGGLEGARNGACLMVGGDEAVYNQVRPILEKIAVADGLGYFGSPGAGHFVKMVHNGIEYGMMGAIAEGFNLIQSSDFSHQMSDEKFDLAKLAKVWAHGSIISGLLMDKAASVFAKDAELSTIAGEVPRGETEEEMEWLETTGIPHEVIQQARRERVGMRTRPSFTGKVIAALRREFGGHKVVEKTA